MIFQAIVPIKRSKPAKKTMKKEMFLFFCGYFHFYVFLGREKKIYASFNEF